MYTLKYAHNTNKSWCVWTESVPPTKLRLCNSGFCCLLIQIAERHCISPFEWFGLAESEITGLSWTNWITDTNQNKLNTGFTLRFLSFPSSTDGIFWLFVNGFLASLSQMCPTRTARALTRLYGRSSASSERKWPSSVTRTRMRERRPRGSVPTTRFCRSSVPFVHVSPFSLASYHTSKPLVILFCPNQAHLNHFSAFTVS